MLPVFVDQVVVLVSVGLVTVTLLANQDYVLALGFKESADDDTTFSQFVVSTLQSCLFCLLPKQRITPPPRRRRRRKKNEVTDDVILLNKRQTRNEPW